MGRIFEEQEGVVDVTAVHDRFELLGAGQQPRFLVVTHENVGQGWPQGEPHANTIDLFIVLVVELKKSVFSSKLEEVLELGLIQARKILGGRKKFSDDDVNRFV